VRLLYTVQRYGEEVVGGSEAAARAFAERLVDRGHEVEVVTSCARSYVDWSDAYQPGVSNLNGVVVNRLPIEQLRRAERFGSLQSWMVSGPHPVPHFQQMRRAKHMGPDIAGYRRWLADNVKRFNAAIFMTYLYSTTTRGLPSASGRVPTLLQPTAHDEPPLWVRLYDTLAPGGSHHRSAGYGQHPHRTDTRPAFPSGPSAQQLLGGNQP